MTVNDRIALEIGRAKLAQIIAEVQRDEAVAQLAAATAPEPPDASAPAVSPV